MKLLKIIDFFFGLTESGCCQGSDPVRRLMVNRVVYIFLGVFIIMGQLNAQDQFRNQVLFTVDNTSVSAEEFLYVYRKNHPVDSLYSRQDVDEYLDLFVKFKIKVSEARRLGIDTTKAYLDELATYEEQLIKPYLSEKEVIEQLVMEAYERRKIEINASHILKKVSVEATPADTVELYNEMIRIRELAVQGHSFDSLAALYSEEPLANHTFGNLGYFTSLRMAYPFESAAYNTPPGSISYPVRTQFGYHIIRVNDKRPSSGRVSVSHIMIRVRATETTDDSLSARDRIFEIRGLAESGFNWEDLCLQYSEDRNTWKRGGKLATFGVGETIPEIAEAAFQLKEIGEISDPVRSPYGWHILRLNEHFPMQSFEELEQTLTKQVKRDARSNLSRVKLIERLKKENGFRQFTGNVNMLFDWDSLMWARKIQNPDTLFTVGSEVFLTEDYRQYVAKSKMDPSSVVSNYTRYEEEEIINFEARHLEEKYVDFRLLMNEYREGLLLFDIMDKKVWSRAVSDSLGLRAFLERNSAIDSMPETRSVVIFAVSDRTKGNSIKDRLDPLIGNPKIQNDSLINLAKSQNEDVVIIRAGWIKKGDFEYVDEVMEKPGIYLQVEDNATFRIVVVRSMLPNKDVLYNLNRGRLISDYQDYLDERWIQELKETFSIKLNKKTQKRIYKELGV